MVKQDKIIIKILNTSFLLLRACNSMNSEVMLVKNTAQK